MSMSIKILSIFLSALALAVAEDVWADEGVVDDVTHGAHAVQLPLVAVIVVFLLGGGDPSDEGHARVGVHGVARLPARLGLSRVGNAVRELDLTSKMRARAVVI